MSTPIDINTLPRLDDEECEVLDDHAVMAGTAAGEEPAAKVLGRASATLAAVDMESANVRWSANHYSRKQS